MQTPNTPRGRETERLMLLWRKQNPDADPSAYNREWESVYRKLEGEFSDKEVDPRFKDAFDSTFDDEPRRTLVGISSDVVPPKQRPRDPRHKHAAQTKGAFGKPKHLRRR